MPIPFNILLAFLFLRYERRDGSAIGTCVLRELNTHSITWLIKLVVIVDWLVVLFFIGLHIVVLSIVLIIVVIAAVVEILKGYFLRFWLFKARYIAGRLVTMLILAKLITVFVFSIVYIVIACLQRNVLVSKAIFIDFFIIALDSCYGHFRIFPLISILVGFLVQIILGPDILFNIFYL